ncbi:MAG: hypothetical protein Q7J86_02695, partial [Bacteroidota bacterium]|nr:hypothetical protein [Bacteroidota bacterium]
GLLSFAVPCPQQAGALANGCVQEKNKSSARNCSKKLFPCCGRNRESHIQEKFTNIILYLIN